MLLQVPHQSYAVWKVCITILHGLAVTVSASRIWLRYRRRRLWWDDYSVVLTVLFDIFYCITLFTVPPPGQSLESMSKATNVWLGLFPSLSVAWLSRISFLLLLARLFPPRHFYHRITLTFAVLFLLTYLTLIALAFPRCDGVHLLPPPSKIGRKNCKIFTKITPWFVLGLTTHLLSDLILVVWPLLMLYRVKLSRPKDRPLVMVSLGCSIFTFLLIVVAVFFSCGPITQDKNAFIVVNMLTHMTAAVSLIVCNMPVVACAAYRVIQRARGVPLGTVVRMPDASTIDSGGDAESDPSFSSLPSSAVSKESGPTNDTRLTYDNLTRISISYERSEVPSSSPSGASPTGTSDARQVSASTRGQA